MIEGRLRLDNYWSSGHKCRLEYWLKNCSYNVHCLEFRLFSLRSLVVPFWVLHLVDVGPGNVYDLRDFLCHVYKARISIVFLKDRMVYWNISSVFKVLWSSQLLLCEWLHSWMSIASWLSSVIVRLCGLSWLSWLCWLCRLCRFWLCWLSGLSWLSLVSLICSCRSRLSRFSRLSRCWFRYWCRSRSCGVFSSINWLSNNRLWNRCRLCRLCNIKNWSGRLGCIVYWLSWSWLWHRSRLCWLSWLCYIIYWLSRSGFGDWSWLSRLF